MREFLDGTYKSELNCSNLLGQGGKLAEAFGWLMEKLWQVSWFDVDVTMLLAGQ
jgi:hypothetical protein